MVYPDVFVQSHLHRKWAPFRAGQWWTPYPDRYSRAFAFSSILYLHLRSPSSQKADSASWALRPGEEKYRLTARSA